MKINKVIKKICIVLAAVLLICSTCLTGFAEDANIEDRDIKVVQPKSASISENSFAGKKIGVLIGSVFDQVALKNFKDVEILYYNSDVDVAIALEQGKIDAYVSDEPIVLNLKNSYPNHIILKKLSDEDYGFIFSKTDKGEALRQTFNQFLYKCMQDGTIDDLETKWLGEDESKKIIDFPVPSEGSKGKLLVATSSSTGAPFIYDKNGRFVGYEAELISLFCRAEGYSLEFFNTDFGGIISAVTQDICDVGICSITITDERKESVLFSDPVYSGGTVLVTMKDTEDLGQITIEDFYGAKIGVITGSVLDQVAKRSLPNCKVKYLNSNADLIAALETGKIKGYIVEEPYARYISKILPDQVVVATLERNEYAFMLQKDDSAEDLQDEISEFIEEIRKSGHLAELAQKWFDGSDSERVVDYSILDTNASKTLRMGTCTQLGVPFAYYQDEQIQGYEIDIAVEFCAKYGYNLEIEDYSFAGALDAVQSGIVDFVGACVTITPEREENVRFTTPTYIGGTVLVTTNSKIETETKLGFFESFFKNIREGFEKTFIRENRWKLFVSGIFNTFLMTIASIVSGTVLGFLLYIICRRGNKIANTIAKICVKFVEGLPAVVLLLILYYVIFGKMGVSNIIVAIIGFTLTFGASVFGMLNAGVKAVDNGQNEAAFALGFSDTKTFYKIILPQAANHFLPLFKSEVVAHIKATSIAGYIAVQDITKMSDIIRTRTYDAFFPLIATAIFYFALELLLIFLVGRIQVGVDTRKRKPSRILKGIKTK